MTGFLRQRGSSWELRVYAGCDIVSGRDRWVTRTVRGGKFTLAGPGYSPKGARETRGVMDRNLLPFLGNVPLSKLGAADIDRFYRRLREKAGGPAAPAPATIRRAHGILHRALVQGVKWGWLSANPASSATPPRIPIPDVNPPASHELARLFALATEVDVDLVDYVLLAATGARGSELIALRWPDLELDKRSV